MDRVTQTFYVLRTTVIAALLLFASVIANANIAGQVIMVKGTATAISADGQERALQRRSEINANDTIVTGSDSRVQIRFIDNALLALQEKSRLNIHEYSLAKNNGENEKVLMELVEGGFRTLTGTIGKGNRDAYAVNTPVASIGVRGTLYSVHLNGGQLSAGVWQGGIVITTPNGREFNLGRDSAFSFGVFNNNNFRGLRTPPADLDAGDNTADTGAANSSDSNADNNSSPDDNSGDENSGDNNFDTGSNHPSSPAAPNTFEQMNTDVIQGEFVQKFVRDNNNISATELTRYSESERYVLINIESQVTLAKWVMGDNNQPIFIVQNGSGVDVYRYSGANAALQWDSLTPYEDLLSSGIWAESGQPQVQLHTKNNISTINGPLEWISAGAFIPDVNPSMDSLTIDANPEFATDSRGNNGNANIQMNIDLRSGTISAGTLWAEFNSTNESFDWEGNFEGGIDLKTGLINVAFTSGSLLQTIGSTDTDGIFDLAKSNIGGFLIGDNEASGFLGWFNIHGTVNGNAISAGSFFVGSAEPYLGYEHIPEQFFNLTIDRIAYVLIGNEIHMGTFVHENGKTSFVGIYPGDSLDSTVVTLVARSNAAFSQVTNNSNWGVWGSANNPVYIQAVTRGSDMPRSVNSIQFADFAPFEYVSNNGLTGTLEFFASSQNSFGIDSYGNALSNAAGYFLYNQGNGGISNGNLTLDFGTSLTSTHWSFNFQGGYESGGGHGFYINPSDVTLTVGSNPHSGSQPSATLEGILTQGATPTTVGGALTAHQLSADDIWASAVIQWNMQQHSITPGGP